MKRKIGWLILSCLMALSLVLASCAPAVEEEAVEEVVEEEVVEEEVEMVTLSFTKDDGTTVERTVEKPRYGGTFIHHRTTTTMGFDQAFDKQYSAVSMQLTNEELMTGDRSKFRGGTGEAVPYVSAVLQWQYEIPHLATGWETPDPNTIIIHLRPGVHFHNKPPTNGRELTADDVAFNIERVLTEPLSYLYGSYGPWFVSAEATGRYTVEVKGNDDAMHRTALVMEYIVECLAIFPKDAIEEFGDMRDWENAIGTGPFILTDHVPGSSALYVRNPDYWATDPWFPENQLPYVDEVKVLIIADKATYLAALRTGQLDRIEGIVYEDAMSLIDTNPDWLYVRDLAYSSRAGLQFRVDMPELPAYDINVRRALAMAVDNEAIARDYFMGDAEILAWPAAPEYADVYTPLEELPENIRELYEYHPDTARQLLEDAGQPSFKCKIICTSAQVDALSIVKAYWEDVGVELELEVKESAVLSSMSRAFEYEMTTTQTGSLGTIYKMFEHLGGGAINYSRIEDPYLDERFGELWAWENLGKSEVRDPLAKEITVRILENCCEIMIPRHYEYRFWAPWVKGYWGSRVMGMHNRHVWLNYLWMDTELKDSMGY